MPTKQSNKQTQNVKVNVINKIDSKCCDDKKKKSKPKRRREPQPPPEEPPLDEFPVLNTPARNTAMPNISALPVRNTVYIPNSVQISPEGVAPPVPAYFEKYYTNMTRTMEDMRQSLLSELEDVKQLIPVRPAMTTEGTQMPQLTDETFAVDIPPVARQTSPENPASVQFVRREPAAVASSSSVRRNLLFEEEDETPTQETESPSRKQEEDKRRKFYRDNYNDEQIDFIYQSYINKFSIDKKGRPATKKPSQINNILAFEKQYGRVNFDA